MSRFLEAVFVLGCSLVGFGLSAGEGNAVHSAVQYAVQLVSERSGWVSVVPQSTYAPR